MQRNLASIFSAVFVLLASASFAQTDTTSVTSVDPTLLTINGAKVPKEYTIRSIKITGINTLDTAIVQSISGMQVAIK